MSRPSTLVFLCLVTLGMPGCLVVKTVETVGDLAAGAVKTTGNIAASTVSTTGSVVGSTVKTGASLAASGVKTGVGLGATGLNAAASLAKAGAVVLSEPATGRTLALALDPGRKLSLAQAAASFGLRTAQAYLVRKREASLHPRSTWDSIALKEGDVVVAK